MALTIESGITVEGGITAGDVPMTSIVTDGLVLYYDFSNPASYSGTGTSITDLSSAANNGTVVNDYSAISYAANGQTSYFNWSTNVGGSGSNQFGGCISTASTNLYQDFTMVFEPDFSVSGIAGLFGIPGDKSMRFYNNAWQAPNPGNGAFSGPTQLYVGTSGYENRNMQGNIAVVLMYDRTLTAEEQLQNFNYFESRFGL